MAESLREPYPNEPDDHELDDSETEKLRYYIEMVAETALEGYAEHSSLPATLTRTYYGDRNELEISALAKYISETGGIRFVNQVLSIEEIMPYEGDGPYDRLHTRHTLYFRGDSLIYEIGYYLVDGSTDITAHVHHTQKTKYLSCDEQRVTYYDQKIEDGATPNEELAPTLTKGYLRRLIEIADQILSDTHNSSE